MGQSLPPLSPLPVIVTFVFRSSGRKKIASNSRASHMVSHFVLSDQAILKQQQSSLKADSSSRFVSPARKNHRTEGLSSSQGSETKPVPNSHRSRSVSPKKRLPNSPPSANKNSTPLDDSSESMSRTEGSARPPRHQQSISSRIRSQSPKTSASTSPSPRSSPTPQQRISNQGLLTPSHSPATAPIQIDTSEEALEPSVSSRSPSSTFLHSLILIQTFLGKLSFENLQLGLQLPSHRKRRKTCLLLPQQLHNRKF